MYCFYASKHAQVYYFIVTNTNNIVLNGNFGISFCLPTTSFVGSTLKMFDIWRNLIWKATHLYHIWD